MSDNPYQAAQTTSTLKRNWRVVLPVAFGVADGLFILCGYLINSGVHGRYRLHEYLNIAGLIPLVIFSDPKSANLAILNQVLYFGGGMLPWVLIGWFIGIYLDGRRNLN